MGVLIAPIVLGASLAAWVVGQPRDAAVPEAILERGRSVFNERCSSCHGVDGLSPTSEKADFRAMELLDWEKILKSSSGRVKESAEDAYAVARFIEKLNRTGRVKPEGPQ
jgi:mono/diheme cytochrome c family protein